MKRIVVTLVGLSIAGSLVAGTAASATLKGAVYSPEPGVVCDKKGGFCADSEGLSVAMTKLYLGAAAEKKLMDRIKKEPGIQDYDTARFTLTNGVSCDCKAKKCRVSKYEDRTDAAYTKALFGAPVAAAVPVTSAKQGKPVTLKGAVYSPDPGALCDKKGGYCADYEGISVALTKMYLGAKAEAHLMDEINKVGMNDFDATTFTMSDGIYCDCKAKLCKDKLSGKPDAAHTMALFGK